MGADIHLAAEVRVNGLWKLCTRPTSRPLWEGSEYLTSEWYSDRNYTVFSALAGVRYGYDYKIDEPRGLPEDADPETIRFAYPFPEWLDEKYRPKPREDGEYDDPPSGVVDGEHSESWFLLSEIFEWPYWDRRPRDKYDTLRVFSEIQPDIELIENAGRFLEAMDELAAYAKKEFGCEPYDVRIVFNFDS